MPIDWKDKQRKTDKKKFDNPFKKFADPLQERFDQLNRYHTIRNEFYKRGISPEISVHAYNRVLRRLAAQSHQDDEELEVEKLLDAVSSQLKEENNDT